MYGLVNIMIKKIHKKRYELEFEIKKRYFIFLFISIIIIVISLALIMSVNVNHDIDSIVPPSSCVGAEDKILQWDGNSYTCVDISSREFKRYVTIGLMQGYYDTNNGIYNQVLTTTSTDIGPHRACFLESVFEGSPESRDTCRLTFLGSDINDVNGGMWGVDRGSQNCHMAIGCIDW